MHCAKILEANTRRISLIPECRHPARREIFRAAGFIPETCISVSSQLTRDMGPAHFEKPSCDANVVVLALALSYTACAHNCYPAYSACHNNMNSFTPSLFVYSRHFMLTKCIITCIGLTDSARHRPKYRHEHRLHASSSRRSQYGSYASKHTVSTHHGRLRPVLGWLNSFMLRVVG